MPNSNKVSNEGEENKKSKKLFDSAVAPFIPTLRPRPTTTLSSLFLEPAGLTNRPEEKDQPQQEEDDGEEEEEVNGGFFTSTALPIVTALPTFSTATGRGFDPFNLGPPPQPKIPASVLSRLPPPANRKLPVAIFTTPAPFTTAPPAQQLPFNAALGVEDNNGDSDLPRPQPTPSPDRGAGRFLPSSTDTGSGRAQPLTANRGLMMIMSIMTTLIMMMMIRIRMETTTAACSRTHHHPYPSKNRRQQDRAKTSNSSARRRTNPTQIPTVSAAIPSSVRRGHLPAAGNHVSSPTSRRWIETSGTPSRASRG